MCLAPENGSIDADLLDTSINESIYPRFKKRHRSTKLPEISSQKSAAQESKK